MIIPAMKSFFYTKSQVLSEQISIIDDLNKALLLKPLSPKDKMKFRWIALVNRIHFSFLLANRPAPIEIIKKLFTNNGKIASTEPTKQIVKYKQALDYLYQNWLVNNKQITPKVLIELYKIAFDGKLTTSVSELEEALRYVQINPEHPVIQAALAQIVIYSLSPFSKENELFSQLIFLLFLYKNGYDFRRIFVFEEFFYRDLGNYKNIVQNSIKKQNLTEWLDYVSRGISYELQKTLRDIDFKGKEEIINVNFFELNDRQKNILSLFNNPGNKISNMIVMKRFRISPVTASRDLAKLKNLGLLLTIGKGRSTYYIKV